MFTASDVKELREKTGVGMMDCKKALTEADGNMEKAIEILREKGMATAAKKASRIAAEGVVAASIKGNVGTLVEVNCETDFVAKGDAYQAFVADIADYVVNNDVADIDALVAAKQSAVIEATAKIGEKISLRRFAKFTTEDGILESYIHMGGKVGVLVEVTGADTEASRAFAHDVALQIAAAKPSYVVSSEVPQAELEKEKEILTAQALNEGKPAAIVEKMVLGRINKYYKDVCLMDQQFVKNPDISIKQYLASVNKDNGLNLSVKRFVRFEMGEGLEKRVDNFVDEVMSQIK
ncbi:MAG: elongation factor Ts [Clostridia bacterium]|nr:elongation factor Ts [Clostridia bacterium]MBR5986980.1 elongation factor Ts [Clostridia bacterium]